MFELKDVERAVKYLGETDESYAVAKAAMIAGKEKLKTRLAECFMTSKGANVKERESAALSSISYRAQIEIYQDSILYYETMRNKRLRAELTVEVWRSLNSARSKGVVT